MRCITTTLAAFIVCVAAISIADAGPATIHKSQGKSRPGPTPAPSPGKRFTPPPAPFEKGGAADAQKTDSLPPGGTRPSQTTPVPMTPSGQTRTTVNATNITYSRTTNGLVIGGATRIPFSNRFNLHRGDVIVSVGGVRCAGSRLSLQQLVDLACNSGNRVVIVRDVSTGELVETELNGPADSDDRGVNAGNGGIAGVTMIGSENLARYGRLEFRFGDNGQTTMIDTDGSTQGVYSTQGNTVTLTFYNGTVVYTGVVSSEGISGTAKNSRTTWSFKVSR